MLVMASLLMTACVSSKNNHADNRIVTGTIDSLYSDILKEQRKIWVYVPRTDRLFARKSFPVVYLLDGEAHFNSVMGLVQQLSEVNMNMVLPQMIVVGIQNTDRTRDMTPTKDTMRGRTSGGGENFTLFLEKELIPYIDSHLPTNPYRILIGHSFGGLFCVNTLLNHTKLFNAYLAIDPSTEWDKKLLVSQARTILSEKKFEGTSFFLSIANQGYSDTDTSRDNASAFELAACLDSNKRNGLNQRWQYYKDDNHGSVPLISEYDGLRFIFDFYNPRISYANFRNPSYDVESFINAHYSNVSIKMGFTVHPPESLLNWLGYLYIMERQYQRSYNLFKMNIDNYPTSANAFDSMGELLLLQGDSLEALVNYEKSLAINPENVNARNLIAKLKKHK
jgi:hypothetical protein